MQELHTLSSPGCYDYCYLGTNESGLNDVFRFFEARFASFSESNPKVHLGVSGWYNFDLCCVYKPSHIILFDSNLNQVRFLNDTVAVIRQAATKEEFQLLMQKVLEGYRKEFAKNYLASGPRSDKLSPPKSVLFHANISKDSSYDCGPSIEEQYRFECARSDSWLNNYAYIRELVLTDRIFVLTLNVSDLAKFESMRKTLDKNSLTVSSIYISNVVDYTDPETYVDWLNLWDKETIFVCSSRSNDLRQEIIAK